MIKVAIIGAGLSGLTAAKLLKDCAEITIFEKARGVSGRMSTRREESYFFDHGAQYFTARTRPFQSFIQPLINLGIIEPWNALYVKFDGNKITGREKIIDNETRYVGVPGMNAVAKHLAESLNVHIHTQIVSLSYENKWQLVDDEGKVYQDFDWVISAIPAQQATKLLPSHLKYYDDIESIKMRPCFSLMLGFEKSMPLGFDAAHIINSDLSWISVNSSKPGRAQDYYTLVVHSSGAYAEERLNDDREVVMKDLISKTSKLIRQNADNANYKNVHRWLYASNIKQENSYVFLDKQHKIASCGDWCSGGRVEGAFTSAYNLVNAMKDSVL